MKGTHKHNTQKLNWEVLTITYVFMSEKRVNICEHTVNVAPSLCAFAYTYSLLIEKDICDCWNISVKLPCVYVFLSFRSFHVIWLLSGNIYHLDNSDFLNIMIK